MESDLRGVILDIDGTLVDSNDAHAEAWRLALSEFGIIADIDLIRRHIGLGAHNLLPSSMGIEIYSPVGRAITRRRREIFKTRFLPHLNAFPHARELLRSFHSAGVRVIAASAAQAAEAAALIDIVEAARYVDFVVTADDEPAGVRDHDLVRTALKKSNLQAAHSVMVGDTPYDYEASRKARVPFIALLCGGWPASAFPEAYETYESPADMLRNFQFPRPSAHAICAGA
jgi:phosphoglycolate phosphatase-like HAD superfamily hydrolase